MAGVDVVLQGPMALVGEERVRLNCRERALLDTLAARLGTVFSRPTLVREMWRSTSANPHAVEVAVAPLCPRLGKAGAALVAVPGGATGWSPEAIAPRQVVLAPLARVRRRPTLQDMMRPLPIVLGVVAALVVGTGVSMALIRSDDDDAAPPPATTTTTVEVTTTTTAAKALPTTRPATTVARVATTRVTAPATTTTRATAAATTTTKAPLTKAAATQGLCRGIEAAVRLVAGATPSPGAFAS